MLCATWAMTGSTFDPRFQRFCSIHLDLRPGRPSIAGEEEAVQLPNPDDWRRWSSPLEGTAGPGTPVGASALRKHMEAWQREAGLNFWEAELVAKYLRVTEHRDEKLFPVYLTVESPRPSDRNPLRFNVGYVIGCVRERPEGRRRVFSLHYMRIQNHLRKMGLARDALIALGKDLKVALDVPAPLFDAGKLDQSASDEALPTDDAVTRLRAIIRSLP